jgi:hypothetical protein
MNKHKVAGLIGEMARICDELRTEILGRAPAQGKHVRAPRGPVSPRRKKKGPTEWIKDLVADGYFATQRTDIDVKNELKRRARNCRRVSVAVALSRLVHQESLTRTGDGTKRSPYQYSPPTRP